MRRFLSFLFIGLFLSVQGYAGSEEADGLPAGGAGVFGSMGTSVVIMPENNMAALREAQAANPGMVISVYLTPKFVAEDKRYWRVMRTRSVDALREEMTRVRGCLEEEQRAFEEKEREMNKPVGSLWMSEFLSMDDAGLDSLEQRMSEKDTLRDGVWFLEERLEKLQALCRQKDTSRVEEDFATANESRAEE